MRSRAKAHVPPAPREEAVRKARGRPRAEDAKQDGSGRVLAGTQTLVRGLEVMEAVSAGSTNLADLAAAIGLTRSTTHRLATTLVERRYLNFSRRDGYGLGPKMLELGYLASQRIDLVRVSREPLELLAAHTGDTVHLGILDGTRALYLDKIPGRRRVDISSRIGERQPLRSTGLGKALILDATEEEWRRYYDEEARLGHPYAVAMDVWLSRMREYAAHGYAFDLEENEDRIRCVAAPVRDVTGVIVGAISVSSAAQYMDDVRMHGLTFDVKKTAEVISRSIGHDPATARLRPAQTDRKRSLGDSDAAGKDTLTSRERAAGRPRQHR